MSTSSNNCNIRVKATEINNAYFLIIIDKQKKERGTGFKMLTSVRISDNLANSKIYTRLQNFQVDMFCFFFPFSFQNQDYHYDGFKRLRFIAIFVRIRTPLWYILAQSIGKYLKWRTYLGAPKKKKIFILYSITSIN